MSGSKRDLIDQLFNSSEKRLAGALLLLARYGKDDTPVRTLPKLSLGFIEYNGGIKIKKSLLSVVLHD